MPEYKLFRINRTKVRRFSKKLAMKMEKLGMYAQSRCQYNAGCEKPTL